MTQTPTQSPPPQVETRPSARARISDRLEPSLSEAAAACGAFGRPGRTRADGWTPERKLAFLEVLAATGVVAHAAGAAGMSVQSAYALRNSANGRAFHVAWRAAQRLAYRRVADELLSRALSGVVDVIVHDGKVSERHRFDNRLALALLSRLDRRSDLGEADPAVRVASDEFEEFSRIAADDAAAAEDFLRDRVRKAEEAMMLRRAATFARYGIRIPGVADAPDFGADPRDQWTDDQWERAFQAGLLHAEAIAAEDGP